MAAIDYEAEYSPSTLVPEYAQILERWARDAAAYRAGAAEAGRAELDLRFGGSERQSLDLFLPQEGGAGALALFVHGGWWQMLDRFSFSHMARGLNARGVAVAVTSYDLCPQVSLATIVEQIRAACLFLYRRGGRPIAVFGHSAGGHLAACMASSMAGEVLGGHAISGAFDLAPLLGASMNEDWRLDARNAQALSPLHWPAPRMFDCVVGGLESSEFKRQSRALARKWSARFEEIAGANHFTILDPLTDPGSAMVTRVAEMCEGG
jgi:arylformamidase